MNPPNTGNARPRACRDSGESDAKGSEACLTTMPFAAMLARCSATSSREGREPATGTPTRKDSSFGLIRTSCSIALCRAAIPSFLFWIASTSGMATSCRSGNFVTAIGAGTTYPDYKPAPFIISSERQGVDMVTVVTEGIFSYCGVKVKIDTDRHLGPETNHGARSGRTGRARDDQRIWLADAFARWRTPSDRRKP